jgi:hypothetical protein
MPAVVGGLFSDIERTIEAIDVHRHLVVDLIPADALEEKLRSNV